MVSRRLSASEVDPRSYFLRKREQNARPSKSGNVESGPKKIYLTPKKLKSEIAQDLGIPFLSPATQADAEMQGTSYDGYVYGTRKVGIVPLVVTTADGRPDILPRWVFFIIRQDSSTTSVSRKVSVGP
jgi:hypothetical protein